LDTRQTILKSFSACPLCGHFLASLLAILGDESLESALRENTGPWLKFQWRPSMAAMLTTYYDWYFEPGTQEHSGRCPSCLRRITYLSDTSAREESEKTATLQIERRPGSRV
jgi:hypothetical protein